MMKAMYVQRVVITLLQARGHRVMMIDFGMDFSYILGNQLYHSFLFVKTR